MINPSEENLLGYLIRANEEHEQEELAEQIRTDAKLRKDCQLLQTGLALPAADEEHLDPPSFLAERTCSALWNKVDSGEFPKLPALAIKAATESSIEAATAANQPAEPVATPASAALPLAMAAAKRTATTTPPATDNSLAAPKRRWHWLDLAVASSVLVVIGGVLSTQILSSRTQSLGLSCKNNLQLTLNGVTNYASMNGGRLPVAHERGPTAIAGVYGPLLRQAGYLKNDRTLICPTSERAQEPDLRSPTLDDLQRASPEELPELQRRAGGTYYFIVGYVENGKYRCIKLQDRSNLPIISDPATADKRPGNSHGQRGQFVGFGDGSVRFLSECQVEGCHDNLFLNDANEPAAGLHAGDAVLLESSQSPLR